MMEPWQHSPGRAEWLGTRFVCRVSGAPADGTDTLRAERSAGLLARLHEIGRELHARRDALSTLLFTAIGAAADRPRRNRLIALKRELYNLRPVAGEKVDEALAGLSALDAAEVRAFAGLLREWDEVEAELRAAYAAEVPALRRRFAALLDDADFRNGLLISSRSLHAALGRYAQAAERGGAELGGRDEKAERGLLRYYARMANKATPFSTFCAILPGTFVDGAPGGGGEVFRFHGDPRAKTSYVRLNKYIYGLLFDHLKTRPAFRRALRVELNPTLRREDGRLVFLTAIDAREVFQRLAGNEVLELITARCRGLGRPTLGELVAAVSADERIEATAEEAEAYLDRLIEIGFLRFHTGIREQDADWDLPFRALLDAVDDEHARHAATLLARMREAVQRYAGASVEERARLIEAMHALLNGAVETMEIEQRLRRDVPFYEDATAAARAEISLVPSVRRAFDTWAEWVRLTSRVAWPRGEQATMRHFFDDYYRGRPSVPLLVFYEDFYREHFKGHVEKEAKARAPVPDPELKDYDVANPFGIPYVKALNEAREALGELIRRRWREAPEAEEIDLSPREVAAALEEVEAAPGVCRSMGAFACLVPPAEPGGGARLVLQGGSYTAGFGKYFSRFLYMLPDDVQEQVRRENAALTDDLLAEICGDAQFNANLHPPLLRWEISYPTGESGAAEEQLRSSDLAVERAPGDAHNLRLVHLPSGRRVIPVDLGFLNPRMRPPLYQLVSRFTPAATFSPPFPELPERPQPPTAAGEGAGADESIDALSVDDPPAGASPAAADAPAAKTPAAPRIQVRPRVTFGGSLVLARRRWAVPGAVLPQREAHESAADFFVRANRWRLEAALPETCYVRINPLPEPPPAAPGEPASAQDAAAEAEAQQAAAAAAGEVPGAAHADEPAADEREDAAEATGDEAPEAGKEPQKPRTAQSRDFHKPQFVDFANPLLVGLLGKMGANLKRFTATFEERLPARGDLPRHDGHAYATEIVVQLYFPAAAASAAAPVPEAHAAAVA